MTQSTSSYTKTNSNFLYVSLHMCLDVIKYPICNKKYMNCYMITMSICSSLLRNKLFLQLNKSAYFIIGLVPIFIVLNMPATLGMLLFPIVVGKKLVILKKCSLNDESVKIIIFTLPMKYSRKNASTHFFLLLYKSTTHFLCWTPWCDITSCQSASKSLEVRYLLMYLVKPLVNSLP